MYLGETFLLTLSKVENIFSTSTKMAEERAQTISVANRYVMLVDGMVPGFKNHLAKHVVLKWFGRVIEGRERVTAFLLSNKMDSFHTFSDITPISDISDISGRSDRKTKGPVDRNANCETYTNNYLRKAPARCSHETEMSTTHENIKDCDQKKSNTSDAALIHEGACSGCEFHIEKYICQLKISTDGNDVNGNSNVNQNKFSANAIAGMDGQSYELNENDLRNLFEPEITSQPIVGKIQNINRIKLKEEMAPTIRAINRECGQGDGPAVNADANATKYLEANGEIKFVQISAQTDSALSYRWSKLSRRKGWKRQCKLRIAYSLLNDNDSKVARQCYSAEENACSARISNLSAKVRRIADKVQKSKLPSLDETIQTSNALIRNVNHFGGYLRPVNVSQDRDDFLKSLEADLAEKNPNTRFCVHYANNKFIFNCPSKRPFNEVTYQIHEIVYSTE